MGVYDLSGTEISEVFNSSNIGLESAYDINGENVLQHLPENKYTNYTKERLWQGVGDSHAQGFDIYDDKVFWAMKSGNAEVECTCFVYNLSDGSQALESQPITINAGHGNNLSFSMPFLYASNAYNTKCYVNRMASDYTATLEKTLILTDGAGDCDACIDETDNTILWSIGHNGTTGPYNISQWDLTDLTEVSSGLYLPKLLHTVKSPLPDNTHYFQGCKFHDGLFWYGNGYPGIPALIIGINPFSGRIIYRINMDTTNEIEGIAWVEDETSYGGYALYVGFAGVTMRKVTFLEPESE